jgi:hypothetical protein
VSPLAQLRGKEIDMLGDATDVGIVVVRDHAYPHGAGSMRKVPWTKEKGQNKYEGQKTKSFALTASPFPH